MKKITLDIVGVSHSVTQSNNYAAILSESKGKRRLPIVIGAMEAQAIAIAMEGMTPGRPLTHDLIKNIFNTFEIDLKEVIINNLLDGVFYARLICQRDGKEIEIDSRTSDALAMAARFKCPIYTYEFILDQAGVVLEESQEVVPQTKKKATAKEKEESLASISLDVLHNMLKEVLDKEDYEQAAKIRDEINKRK